MTAYIRITGALFGLITLAHLLRIIVEWPRFATDTWYLLLTAASAALCVWALRLLRPSARSR
jgi:hypothetical protein